MKGTVEAVEEGGVRYNKLTSTEETTMGQTLYSKKSWFTVDVEGKCKRLTLNHQSKLTSCRKTRLVYVKYKDNDNNILLDMTRRLFWRYSESNVNHLV